MSTDTTTPATPLSDTPLTRFREQINRIASLQVEKTRLSAERDAEIQRAQRMGDAAIAAVEAELEHLLTLAEAFADRHRDEILEPGTKSGHTELATYRFFMTPVKIEPLTKKFKTETVLELMRGDTEMKAYIRTKESINKDAIADSLASGTLKPSQLAGVGLRATQSEKFEVNPLVESGEKVTA